VTADIAQKFNHRYGETFIIPKEKIMGDVAVVPGTDGQKMSKSYNNTINIFGTEKQIRKTIMKVVTDSTALQDPKDADNCNVFALYNLFANKSEEQRLKERYQAGGMGYGHAKQELFEKFWEYFRPFRKKREELSQNMDYIQDILKKGGEKARQTASTTLDKVKKATGL
ncbi:MAG: tryptophan--tRNA ligase, partial [Verrucomicrobiota bacterium]|nr:tryptophan--tRNA ligase [Verrucomicrobiota bacterium]